MKDFLEINFTIEPEEGRDILLAWLDNMGYDSFQETEEGLKAYILEKDFDENALQEVPLFSNPQYTISYEKDKLENKNWNEEWETHYAPIVIEDRLHVRAPFHQARPDIPLEILITPKMSFGTGHHQTTRLMSRLLLDLELNGKKVLDMGTGTGILAILAEKLGAAEVTAIDNFEWAVENTAENAEKNNCLHISARLGDAEMLAGLHFDVVLANINRNVLLEDMKSYIDTLQSGDWLLLSGFFIEDFEVIEEKAKYLGASLKKKITEDRWMACQFQIQ